MIKLISWMILASLVALGQAGCGGGHDHSEAGPHHHDPPHGGAGVTLGDEEAHIEFLVDAEAGTVTAWFFKPHMERYLRIKAGASPCSRSKSVYLRVPVPVAGLSHAVILR